MKHRCFICRSATATARENSGSASPFPISKYLVQLLHNGWISEGEEKGHHVPAPFSTNRRLQLAKSKDDDDEQALTGLCQKVDSCGEFLLCTSCKGTLLTFNGILDQFQALAAQVIQLREDVLQLLGCQSGEDADEEPLSAVVLRGELVKNFKSSLTKVYPVTSEFEIKAEPDEVFGDVDLDFGLADECEREHEDLEPQSVGTANAQHLDKDPFAARVKLMRLDVNTLSMSDRIKLRTKRRYAPTIESLSAISGTTHHEIIPAPRRPGARRDYWPCADCGRVLTRKSTLLGHRLKKHRISLSDTEEPRPFWCEICSMRFTTRGSLERHKLVPHHIEDEDNEQKQVKPIRGRGSQKSQTEGAVKPVSRSHRLREKTVSRSQNNQKSEVHPAEEQNEVDNDNEGKDWKPGSDHETNDNDASASNDKDFWPCSDCGRILTTKRNLFRHRETQHGIAILKKPKPPTAVEKLRPFTCPACPREFAAEESIRRHMAAQHQITDQDPKENVSAEAAAKAWVTCDECGKVLSTRHNLLSHKQCHKGIRPFMCEVCSQTFSCKANLQNHQTKHPELKLEPFKCELCQKLLGSAGYLKVHMKTQHEGAFRFTCPEPGCGYRCWAQHKLEYHQSFRHRNERKFVCTVADCGATYSRKVELQHHIRRKHTGERRYACDLCPSKFFESGHLARHKQIHANDRCHLCPHCPKRFAVRNNLMGHIHDAHDPPEVRQERLRRKKEAKQKRLEEAAAAAAKSRLA